MIIKISTNKVTVNGVQNMAVHDRVRSAAEDSGCTYRNENNGHRVIVTGGDLNKFVAIMKTKPVELFAHLQDMGSNTYVGPFKTEAALKAHVKWCQDKTGDGAVLVGIVTALPDDEDAFTPEEDKAQILSAC